MECGVVVCEEREGKEGSRWKVEMRSEASGVSHLAAVSSGFRSRKSEPANNSSEPTTEVEIHSNNYTKTKMKNSLQTNSSLSPPLLLFLPSILNSDKQPLYRFPYPISFQSRNRHHSTFTNVQFPYDQLVKHLFDLFDCHGS